MGQVFISYAIEDEKAARRLHDELKARGGKPWLDRIHLIGGEPWRKAVKKAIDDSMHVIVLMSKHSMENWGEVQREIRYALRQRRKKYPGKTFVVPVRLDQSGPPRGIMSFLRGLRDLGDIHWIDLSQSNSKAMDQIWKALTEPSLHP